jgi:hypothetical protein
VRDDDAERRKEELVCLCNSSYSTQKTPIREWIYVDVKRKMSELGHAPNMHYTTRKP